MKAYPCYKNLDLPWLSEVPSHWDVDRIGRHFFERKTKVSDKDFAPLSVGKKGVLPQLATVAVTKNGDNRKLVRIGDYVFNSRSDRRGSSGISEYEGSVSVIYTVLIPHELSERWCHYLFRSHAFIEEFYRNGRGIVDDLWTTHFSETRGIFIPLPPRDEQDQIVWFLDWKVSEVNNFIREKRREIKRLQELRKSIISKAVTKGGDNWTAMRTPAVFDISKGLSISRSDMKSEGVPCVHYGDIHGECGFEVNPANHPLGLVSESQIGHSDVYLKYGDFLFCGSSEDLEGSGNFTYFNSKEKAIAGTDTIRLRAKNTINYRYFAYLFDSQPFRDQIRVRVNGIKVYHPNQSILRQTIVITPPEDEQKTIVEYLDKQCADIQAMITAIKSEIALMTEYRTRVISDVVTGKADVRDVVVPDFAVEEAAEDEDDVDDEEAFGEEVEESADD